METTVNQKIKRGPSTLVIVLLFLLLIGGGVGVFFMLKPLTDKKEPKEKQGSKEKKPSGATGRKVTTPHYTYDPAVLAKLLNRDNGGTAPPKGKPGSSPNTPIYYKDPTVLNEIANIAAQWQLDSSKMDIIRAKYDIGKQMVGRQPEEKQAIDEVLGKLDKVNFTSHPDKHYLAYPVYGTKEPQGKKYRAELQNILDRGWEGLNLTHSRDSTAPWWCKNIGLNLLVGTTWPNTPKTDDVWRSWAPRSEVDFFKKLNRHWVQDADLADVFINRHNTNQVVGRSHPDARAAYCATGMFEFVERWVEEIDRLDRMTEFEVFRYMGSEHAKENRWYFTYTNPNTGVNEENTTDNPFYSFINTTGKGGAART